MNIGPDELKRFQEAADINEIAMMLGPKASMRNCLPRMTLRSAWSTTHAAPTVGRKIPAHSW